MIYLPNNRISTKFQNFQTNLSTDLTGKLGK